MKKGLLVLVVLLLLAGCSKDKEVPASKTEDIGTKEDTSKDDAKETTSTKPGFEFDYNGVTIPMNVDAAPVVEALGETTAYMEAASCAFQGLDKFFTYSGFELSTYPDGEKDMVYSVYFLDDSVTTKEGIYIGSSKDDVIAAYGEDYTEKSSQIAYTMGETELAFILEEDMVTSITYSAIVEGMN